MLTKYFQAAMRRAKHETWRTTGPCYGHIPELQGVWANEATLEECREELESTLEDWILTGIWLKHPIPPIGGVGVKVTDVPVEA